MIRSEELRIRNYYQWYADGKYYYFKIKPEDFQKRELANFEPIPLTEEILFKCGFEKTIVNTMIKAWLNFSFYLTIRDDGELFYEWNGGNIQVKYLHQLQNLYFSLVGKELEVEL